MFQECFLTYYTTRTRNIDQHFLAARESFDPEAIHDLRVEIKQLRSFFNLLEWIAPEFQAKKQLRSIRKLFKSAAKLRDAHVQQELTRGWSQDIGTFLSEYYNTLKEKEFPARKRFFQYASDFDLQGEIEANARLISDTLNPLSDKDAASKMRKRVESLLQQIIEYGTYDRLKEEYLHKLRILSKETRYTLQVTTQCFPELGYSNKLDKQLRSLHQVLGKWHDTEIAIQHIEEFLEEFQPLLADAPSAMFPGKGVYEELCKSLGEEKIDLLDLFEKRWDEFMQFLKTEQAG